MRVGVSGSSGLIGSSVVGALQGARHEPVRLVRRAPRDENEISWDPESQTIDTAALASLDAVIHLAGAGIGDKRWTDERKRVVLESRTLGTATLARGLAEAWGDDPSGKRLLSGSAIGFYGDRGDEILTEASPAGSGFLSSLCEQWEAAAQPAIDAGISTAFLRTGLVQSSDGGALAKSLPLFKLGLGGRFGDGTQWWSWISIDDEVRAILHLLEGKGADVTGPVNLTGPEPVTNADYTKALGRALHRPTPLPVPMIGPRLLLGRELSETLLLDSDRVLPTALQESGFEFRHTTIDDCLAAVLGATELA